MENKTRKVVCIAGDGIGPEVTAAMKAVVAETGAPIEWVDRPAGLGALTTAGDTLPEATLVDIAEHRLAIKGPTNTPKGEGHVSVNVRLRKIFDLYVGFRPYVSLPFFGLNPRDRMDLMLFRQNTEGLYACQEELIEGPDGAEVRLAARFTAKAMERLSAYAFRLAAVRGRKRVTLVTKSNIHKGWGKLYRDAFMNVAARFPMLETEEMLIDATAMILATNPRRLDVIVTENMFGDILSDQCAGNIGGLGVAPGANIGDDCAIFEAVHGSADDIAGQDKANPTALILSSAMLLEHAGFHEAARKVREAVSRVISNGIHATGDVLRYYPDGTVAVGTCALTDAVCRKIRSDP
jgi:isocitrate dehydrogenase (NAD+)